MVNVSSKRKIETQDIIFHFMVPERIGEADQSGKSFSISEIGNEKCIRLWEGLY